MGNNLLNVNNNIIPEINRTPNTKIKYRCVFDKNVYGNTEDHKNMKNNLHGGVTYYAPGFNSSVDANQYIDDTTAKKKSKIDPDYVITILDKENNENTPFYKDLRKYAMFTGGYSSNNDKLFDSKSSNVLRVVLEDLEGPQPKYNEQITPESRAAYHTDYDNSTPLICNVVYPQVLGLLDANTKNKNEISCQYANICGISWNSLKCNQYQDMTLIKK